MLAQLCDKLGIMLCHGSLVDCHHISHDLCALVLEVEGAHTYMEMESGYPRGRGAYKV